jgi:hypothetical protein
MDTIELRHMINEKISLIDDESFLVAIKTILDSKVSSSIYQLSDFQKERIALGREQLSNGQVISNEDLQSKFWNKKVCFTN